MLAVSLAVSLAPIGQAKADSTSEVTQTPSITKQIDPNRAIEHVRFLSETIGPRPGGTKSEEWASRYIGMQLKSMGYEVEYQPFQVPDQYVGFIESPHRHQAKEMELTQIRINSSPTRKYGVSLIQD